MGGNTQGELPHGPQPEWFVVLVELDGDVRYRESLKHQRRSQEKTRSSRPLLPIKSDSEFLCDSAPLRWRVDRTTLGYALPYECGSVSARYSWMKAIAMLPSPTPLATRLTEP